MRLFLLLFFLTTLKSFSDFKDDSLRQVIKNSPNDSTTVWTYITMVHKSYEEPRQLLEVLYDMSAFCDNKLKGDNFLKAMCLRKLGVGYAKLNYFDKALEYSFKSAEMFEKINHLDGAANCYNNIGECYCAKGNFTKDKLLLQRAIEYHLKSINIRLKLKNTGQLQNSYNNIGITYMYLEDYKSALDYLNKAYEIAIKQGGTEPIIEACLNLGNCHLKIGSKENSQKNYEKALSYYLNSIKYFKDDDFANIHAKVLLGIGNVYIETGNLSLGISYLEQGLEKAKKIQDKIIIMDAAKKLSTVYEKKGDCKKALDLLNVYNANKDSLINEKNITSTEQMMFMYQTTQKDREINKLNNEKEINEAKLSRQRTITFSAVGAVVFILILVFVLWSRYNLKKKSNLDLSEAYRKIELKNHQITESINYAKRIQTAILTPLDKVTICLKDFFILFKPKDIVSGDLFWVEELNSSTQFTDGNPDKVVLFAVADCTGHGVPGAFMSIIATNLLNQAVKEKRINSCAEILDFISLEINKLLRSHNGEVESIREGMDISLCALNKNKMILEFSGANNPGIILRNNELIELKPDKFHIGDKFNERFTGFKSQEVAIQKNDVIYLFSDGYVDQVGGPQRRKFYKKNFFEMILNIQKNEMPLQKEKLDEVFEAWKANVEQYDDVLVLGVKIT